MQVLFGGTPPISSSEKLFRVTDVDPLEESVAPVGLKEFGAATQKFDGGVHSRIVIGYAFESLEIPGSQTRTFPLCAVNGIATVRVVPPPEVGTLKTTPGIAPVAWLVPAVNLTFTVAAKFVPLMTR